MNDPSTLDIALLDRLRAADGFVPLESLGDEPAETLKSLRELEAFGFSLAWHPYQGVAYAGPAERLCPDQIEHQLGTRRIGRRIAVWEKVVSTNELAAHASATRANEGLVILAEHQSAGRGRRGRSWSAPPCRSILMSVVLRPPTDLGDVAWLTALGAVAVAEVAEWAGAARTRIKWPNDVYVGNRKIAGVLAERRPGVALGIGLNVNVRSDEFPEELRATATSLQIETERPHDRSELARGLIRALDRHYQEALDAGPAALNEPWQARLGPLGGVVRLRTATGVAAGRLIEADLRDGVRIEADDGTCQRVAFGQILALDVESPNHPV